MSKLATFLGANSGPIIGAAVLVVGLVGAGAYFGVLSPKDAVLSVPQEAALPAVDLPEVQETQADTSPKVKVEPEEISTAVRAPSIDEVRSEEDGLTILAGRGEPGAALTLMVDAVEKTTVQVGNDGAFAIVAFLGASPEARVLSVIQRVDDVVLFAADIILAPQAVTQAEAATVETTTTQTVEATTTQTVEVTAEQAAESAAITEPETAEILAAVPAAKVEPASAALPTKPATEVAILKSDEDGVQVINRSSAPELMSNVEIDTISYSEEGDVLISGRAQSEASLVRVYLDNDAITTLDVDTSGRWRGDLPDVDTGIYMLRIDEVDAEGAVTSRVETPFKRESAEVLAATVGTEDAPAKAITVQTGATLWAIARERYGDGTLFVRVFEANADTIKDANLIYPGQVFDLPD